MPVAAVAGRAVAVAATAARAMANFISGTPINTQNYV